MTYANVEMVYGHRAVEENSNNSNQEEQMGMGVMVIVFSLASMMGLWGLSCIASGLFHSGGLLQMGASWLSAARSLAANLARE